MHDGCVNTESPFSSRTIVTAGVSLVKLEAGSSARLGLIGNEPTSKAHKKLEKHQILQGYTKKEISVTTLNNVA